MCRPLANSGATGRRFAECAATAALPSRASRAKHASESAVRPPSTRRRTYLSPVDPSWSEASRACKAAPSSLSARGSVIHRCRTRSSSRPSGRSQDGPSERPSFRNLLRLLVSAKSRRFSGLHSGYRTTTRSIRASDNEGLARRPAVRHQVRNAPRDAPTQAAQSAMVFGSFGESMTGTTMPTHRRTAWGTAVSAPSGDLECEFMAICYDIREANRLAMTRIMAIVTSDPTGSLGGHQKIVTWITEGKSRMSTTTTSRWRCAGPVPPPIRDTPSCWVY